MKQIKESEPFIRELEELRQQIFEKKKGKYEVGLPISEIKEECKAIKDRINKLKANQNNKQSFKETIQKGLDKINEERNKLRKDIAEMKVTKEKNKEDFYSKLLEYEKQ